MALTYTDHVDRAFRGAAVALTLPSPSGPDIDCVRRLHDDVTQALAEATRIILLSSLGEPRVERERAGIPAAKAMLTALSDYPRLAVPAADEPSPAQRWSGRPVDLGGDVTPLGAWQVLAAETFLARSCLDQMTTRLATPLRAAILADLAVVADALATGTEDLALSTSLPTQDAVRGRARELAAAANQVQIETAAARQADSAPVPPVPAAREPRRVQIVRQHTDMPAALANLGRLMVTGRPRASELFATTIMLSTTADALATALDVAARSSRVPDPEGLVAAAETLTDYRRELSILLREHQTKIASLGPGNPAALAQARELRTAGVPRLHALATDANLAAGSAGELQRIAANLAPATASVRAGFAALDTRSGMLAYAWAPGPGFYWRAATTVDAEPLLNSLDRATQTAASLRPTRPVAPARSAHAPARRNDGASIVDLTDAIDRRRAALQSAGDVPSATTSGRCARGASLPIPEASIATPGVSPASR